MTLVYNKLPKERGRDIVTDRQANRQRGERESESVRAGIDVTGNRTSLCVNLARYVHYIELCNQ